MVIAGAETPVLPATPGEPSTVGVVTMAATMTTAVITITSPSVAATTPGKAATIAAHTTSAPAHTATSAVAAPAAKTAATTAALTAGTTAGTTGGTTAATAGATTTASAAAATAAAAAAAATTTTTCGVRRRGSGRRNYAYGAGYQQTVDAEHSNYGRNSQAPSAVDFTCVSLHLPLHLAFLPSRGFPFTRSRALPVRLCKRPHLPSSLGATAARTIDKCI
jgi:hypothetical protein